MTQLPPIGRTCPRCKKEAVIAVGCISCATCMAILGAMQNKIRNTEWQAIKNVKATAALALEKAYKIWINGGDSI